MFAKFTYALGEVQPMDLSEVIYHLGERLGMTNDMVGGAPLVRWKPDLNEEGTKALRTYKIWGCTNLVGGGAWHCPTNALDRFFKVTVEMP